MSEAWKPVRSKFEGNLEVLSPLMEERYLHAQEVFRDPLYSLQEKDFYSTYTEEQVKKDSQYAKRKQAVFAERDTLEEKNLKKISDVFEATVLTSARNANWFSKANVMKTLLYDDYENKIDLIAEWHVGEDLSQLLALGVDVTFSAGKSKQKLEYIRDRILKDELASMKYFKDYRGDFSGTRNNLARCIVGLSKGAVEELATISRQPDAIDQLRKHPAQRVLLNQMFTQLKAMNNFAIAHGSGKSASAIFQAANIIQRIRFANKDIPQRDLQMLGNDPVNIALELATEEVFKVDRVKKQVA
jgi:hypothetical protein